VRDNQEPLDENQPPRQVLGIFDIEVGRIRFGGERRILVPLQQEVNSGIHRPALVHEIEVPKSTRIASGEEDREPGDERHDRTCHPQEIEDEQVRQDQQPFDEDQPARQMLRVFHIRR
jgi:hypothetical protein